MKKSFFRNSLLFIVLQNITKCLYSSMFFSFYFPLPYMKFRLEEVMCSA